MFCIVEIGGFQEMIKEGQTLNVPFMVEAEMGKKVIFDKVLLVVDGENVTMGAPYVSGASVEATIVEHGKTDKVRGVKHHRRKRYKRVMGHRQDFTTIKVSGLKTK
jgi:large subunit ribosomal protein L21